MYFGHKHVETGPTCYFTLLSHALKVIQQPDHVTKF